jgi:hypothetical protein
MLRAATDIAMLADPAARRLRIRGQVAEERSMPVG